MLMNGFHIWNMYINSSSICCKLCQKIIALGNSNFSRSYMHLQIKSIVVSHNTSGYFTIVFAKTKTPLPIVFSGQSKCAHQLMTSELYLWFPRSSSYNLWSVGSAWCFPPSRRHSQSTWREKVNLFMNKDVHAIFYQSPRNMLWLWIKQQLVILWKRISAFISLLQKLLSLSKS